MATGLHYGLAAGAALLVQGCTIFHSGASTRGQTTTAAGGNALGGWPPTSAQCLRNDPVPFDWNGASIGGELTRLFADPACVTQPVCFDWGAKENRPLSGSFSGQFWMGLSNHQFTTAEQNSIGTEARAVAAAQTPVNKSLIRLTFDQAVIVAGGPSTGVVQARAYYGRCLQFTDDIATPKQDED